MKPYYNDNERSTDSSVLIEDVFFWVLWVGLNRQQQKKAGLFLALPPHLTAIRDCPEHSMF
jgi:hypothetical protein